jgi:hypothetical protein
VTNIAMGTEIDSVNEFEEIVCLDRRCPSGRGQDLAALQPNKIPEPAK